MHVCSEAVSLVTHRFVATVCGHRKLSLLLRSPGTSSDLLPLATGLIQDGSAWREGRLCWWSSSDAAQRSSPGRLRPLHGKGPKEGSAGTALGLPQISKKKDQISQKKLGRRGGIALLSVHTVCHPYSMPLCTDITFLRDHK